MTRRVQLPVHHKPVYFFYSITTLNYGWGLSIRHQHDQFGYIESAGVPGAYFEVCVIRDCIPPSD